MDRGVIGGRCWWGQVEGYGLEWVDIRTKKVVVDDWEKQNYDGGGKD